jgi:AcrR family transcriptional regulator
MPFAASSGALGLVKNERSFYSGGMPKVSEEHLAARREQILLAALTCFGENGFHATTMADVISASGLSAGAVYRYFRGKDDLVAAIAERAVGTGNRALSELLDREEVPPLVDVLRHVLGALVDMATSGPTDLRRVALQVWAEALRNGTIMGIARQAQLALRDRFVEVARRSQACSHLPADSDPTLVAQALQSLLIGYVIQHLIVGDVDVDSYLAGVAALLGPPALPAEGGWNVDG